MFGGSLGARADAPVPVQTAVLSPLTWRAKIEISATVDALQSADLAAERAGRVVAVLYVSGQDVAAGTILVRLDDAPETAQLQIDQAKLTETGHALTRDEKLLSIAGASQAALEQAQADAAEARAQLAYDQAALAQLSIAAPFAGTLGIRRISAGDYVDAGQVVATITQTAPLRVLFSVPQTEAGGIALGESFSLQAPAGPDQLINAAGTITALSPQLNNATNARDVEADVTSGAAGLLPGMIGTVTLAAGAREPAFAIPVTALNDSVLGQYVFTLAATGSAYILHTVYVTEYGELGGQAVIAANGLNAGERIVAIGGFKLTDGASVRPETP